MVRGIGSTANRRFEALRERQKGGRWFGLAALNALNCRKSEILDIFLLRSA